VSRLWWSLDLQYLLLLITVRDNWYLDHGCLYWLNVRLATSFYQVWSPITGLRLLSNFSREYLCGLGLLTQQERRFRGNLYWLLLMLFQTLDDRWWGFFRRSGRLHNINLQMNLRRNLKWLQLETGVSLLSLGSCIECFRLYELLLNLWFTIFYWPRYFFDTKLLDRIQIWSVQQRWWNLLSSEEVNWRFGYLIAKLELLHHSTLEDLQWFR